MALLANNIDPFNDGSLIAGYNFDVDYKDYVGTNHGTPTDVELVSGNFGNAVEETATNGNVLIAEVIGTRSISFWTNRPINTINGRMLFSNTALSIESLLMGGDTTGQASSETLVLYYNVGGDTGVAYIRDVVDDTTWKHVVIVEEAQDVYSFYINGVKKTTQYNGYPLALGMLEKLTRIAYSDYAFDQVMYFDRVLSQAEVTELYEMIYTELNWNSSSIFNTDFKWQGEKVLALHWNDNEVIKLITSTDIDPLGDGSLIVGWNFEDDVLDYVGTRNGTASGILYEEGSDGRRIVFDNPTGYSEVLDYVSFTPYTSNLFTLTATTRQTKDFDPRYLTGSTDGGTEGILVGGTQVSIVSNGAVISTVALLETTAIGAEIFISIIVTSTYLKVYIDGVYQGMDTVSIPPITLTLLGTYTTGSSASHFSGTIDKLNIFNKELSYDEINNIRTQSIPEIVPVFDNTIDTTMLDPFGDGSLTNGYNLDGNALDYVGNVDGVETVISYNEYGRFGSNAIPNSSTSIVYLPKLSSDRNASVSLWVNINSEQRATGDVFMFGNVGSTRNYVGYSQDFGTLGFGYGDKYNINVDTGVTPKLDDWTHIVLAFGVDVFTAYMDGIAVFTDTFSGLGVATYAVFCDMYFDTSDTPFGQAFTGRIDQVMLFNRELTPYEADVLYKMKP